MRKPRQFGGASYFYTRLNSFLHTPLNYVKGIGPAKAELLATELNIRTVEDLLQHYPFRYVDRSKVYPIGQLRETIDFVQIKGVLGTLTEEGVGKAKRLRSSLRDETGLVEFIWFKGLKWIKENLKPGKQYVAFGKVALYKGRPSMPHPELELSDEVKISDGYLQPIYSSTEKLTKRGMSSKGFEKAIRSVLTRPDFGWPETLSEGIREELKLVTKKQAIQLIHLPRNSNDTTHARRRLKFEELFFIQLELLLKKDVHAKQIRGFIFESVGDYFNTFYEKYLPFELTGAQKRVLKEIRRDFGSGRQMNRLLQGDVGSGKTMVSALAALMAIDNGFQASVMAPTEILANQHFETFSEMLNPLGLRVEILTGSTKTAKRREIHAGLMSGQVHLLVGTHALLEDKVQFKNIGLAVIDEQHRFGVAQRAKLWRKNTQPPHILVMTATPIPRTLAMTLYGDLEVSVIDELPPGRKPVDTSHVFDNARIKIFGFMEDQIRRGRQIYVVYPLIEESSTLDLKDLMDGYESIERRFPKPDYQISVVHGRMKPKDKDFEMNRFAEGKTQIMVATTVIEVGVNVPNASVMVIESAQRFGLSQLHQLRGRVGRGAEKSYCILVTDKKVSNEARKRMRTMVETNDGFRISEVDLELRGPGDLMGTRQSGDLDLNLANLATDGKILAFARNVAIDLLDEDPELKLEKNVNILRRAKEVIFNKPNWSRIS
ncbi:ATP-dependent DNA helicase RecG [Cryomorphaceae bacterium 1068]|nr:ATP-dependent DNA helicase RecG [Cryomorphaceae bacterium 1068]